VERLKSSRESERIRKRGRNGKVASGKRGRK